MICTTPRSGSTLLCKLLANTKVAGVPDSYFHSPSFNSWLDEYNLKEKDFASKQEALGVIFMAALARGKSDTEIFGLRMQAASFGFFMQQLGQLIPGQMSDVDRIECALGPTLYVHLSRPDRLGQAISRVRAEQTGLWHRNSDGSELERLAPPQEARYDATAIKHHVAEFTAFDKAWDQWFEKEAVKPLRVNYNELSEHPQTVLAKILSALNLDPSLTQSIMAPTAKLADAVSHDWRTRFESES